MSGYYGLAEKLFSGASGGAPVLRLHIGDTNLPPPPEAVAAAAERMRSGPVSYGSAQGAHALRQRIAEREGCAPENVVVGPGSKQLLFGLMSVLAQPGDRVAVPQPAWPAYGLMARQLGLEVAALPATLEGGWRFDPGRIERARLVILCNPLNPTSTVYPRELVEEAAARARDQGAALVIDEAYRGVAFAEVGACAAIRVRSFSKEFSMEGWRLGYAVAPAEVAQRLVAFNQLSITCVPEFVQAAGLACLEQEERILGEAREIWRRRAVTASRALGEAGFQFAPPQSGMYVFATHPRLRDDREYVARLLDDGVAVAPGSAFGAPGFVRICVNQERPILEEAVRRMRTVLGAPPRPSQG